MADSLSRQTILDRLRIRAIESTARPSIDHNKTVHYDDPIAKFIQTLTWVGGRVHQVDQYSDIRGVLDQVPAFSDSKWIASTVPEAVQGNVHLDQIEDPHALVSVDWAILRGEFCVAENGAIWVPTADLVQRTLLFIAQHLVLMVSQSEMAMHMHQAYQRVQSSSDHQRGTPRFGVFISGPSKTADIEQSLVLGAHGCRTLEVFLTP